MKARGPSPQTKAWASFDVGDDLTVPCAEDESEYRQRELTRSANRWAERHNLNRTFKAARIPGGVRIWRAT